MNGGSQSQRSDAGVAGVRTAAVPGRPASTQVPRPEHSSRPRGRGSGASRTTSPSHPTAASFSKEVGSGGATARGPPEQPLTFNSHMLPAAAPPASHAHVNSKS